MSEQNTRVAVENALYELETVIGKLPGTWEGKQHRLRADMKGIRPRVVELLALIDEIEAGTS